MTVIAVFTSATQQTTTQFLVSSRAKMVAITFFGIMKDYSVRVFVYLRQKVKNGLHDPLATAAAKLASRGHIIQTVCSNLQNHEVVYDMIPF